MGPGATWSRGRWRVERNGHGCPLQTKQTKPFHDFINKEFPEQPPRCSPYNPQPTILVEDSLSLWRSTRAGPTEPAKSQKALFKLNTAHSHLQPQRMTNCRGSADPKTGNRNSLEWENEDKSSCFRQFFQANSCPEKAAGCTPRSSVGTATSTCSTCSLRAHETPARAEIFHLQLGFQEDSSPCRWGCPPARVPLGAAVTGTLQ